MGLQILVADATAEQRAAFYRKTYSNLALGLVVFALVESFLLRIEPLVDFMLRMTQGYLWLAMLGGFMGISWVAQNLTYKNADPKLQYAGYFLYILGQALLFVPLIYIAINISGGGMGLINQAAILTAALFLGLTTVVFTTNTDFSFMRSILTVGFFLAIGLIVAGMFFGFELGLWFSVGMVFLAAGSILYSTYNIKNEYLIGQHIPAALALFSSVMLLFWYILRILMRR